MTFLAHISASFVTSQRSLNPKNPYLNLKTHYKYYQSSYPLFKNTVSQFVILITLDLILTIRADNGKGTKNKDRQLEFHKKIASKLNIFFYFARYCHSVEKGSNENLNGFIRQYFNKRIDFTELKNKQTDTKG